MTHMPGNEGVILHQTALAGKRKGIRQFPSKLLEQIGNEARNEKHCFDKQCFDKYGEELAASSSSQNRWVISSARFCLVFLLLLM